jgi:4'-phosphopantetheinyl transferase
MMVEAYPNLSKNEVHVWMIPLDQDPDSTGHYYQVLSVDERNRAERFHFERHRRRFIISHGVLRGILSQYLACHPAEIQFDLTSHGKPMVSGSLKTFDLLFNLTHSHELAVVAVNHQHEIGVDVEYIKKMGDMEKIATRFFSKLEKVAYLDLPEEQRVHGFFNCWTRKEAFIKAIGEGFSYPLDQFDVTLTPGSPVRLLRIGDDPGEAPRWTLESFQQGMDYIGSVALRLRDVQFRYFRFIESGNYEPIGAWKSG